jgi:hypothetical protein
MQRPCYIHNICTSPSKDPIAQRGSYSCDNTSINHPDRETWLCSLSFSPLCWKSKLYSLGIVCNIMMSVSKMKYFRFIHIQGLHIFASTLSDFRWSTREVLTADFSLHWLWCPQSLQVSDVAYSIVVSDIRGVPRSRHHHELWLSQICNWIERI